MQLPAAAPCVHTGAASNIYLHNHYRIPTHTKATTHTQTHLAWPQLPAPAQQNATSLCGLDRAQQALRNELLRLAQRLRLIHQCTAADSPPHCSSNPNVGTPSPHPHTPAGFRGDRRRAKACQLGTDIQQREPALGTPWSTNTRKR